MEYSAASLERAIELYFLSISRTVVATEEVKTNKKDKDGHWIKKERPIKNDLGEKIIYREFVLAPSFGNLRAFCGDMTKAEWDAYLANEETGPVIAKAKDRIEAYLAGQLLTRGKTRGVEFSLSHEFDWKDKKELSLGTGAVEKFLESARKSNEF